MKKRSATGGRTAQSSQLDHGGRDRDAPSVALEGLASPVQQLGFRGPGRYPLLHGHGGPAREPLSPGGSSRKAVCGRRPHWPAASSHRPVCWGCRRTGLGTLRAGSPAAERMGAGVSIHSDWPRPPRRLDPQPHTTDQHAARTTPARHHHSPGWLQHARHSLSASSSTLAARTAAQRGRDPRARSWDGGRSGQRRPSSAPAGRRATPASQAAAGRRSSGGMAGGA